MNIKRIVAAGLVVDALSILIPLPSYTFFGWVFKLPPAEVWKWTPETSVGSMSIGWLAFVFLANTAFAIFLALVYAVFHKAIAGNGFVRGLKFGLLIYPIAVLLPLFSVYVLLNVAGGALLYLALEGLLEFAVYGAALGMVYRDGGGTGGPA